MNPVVQNSAIGRACSLLALVLGLASSMLPAAASAQHSVVTIADTNLSDLNRDVEHLRSPAINGNGTVAFEADIKVPAGPVIGEAIWKGTGAGNATLVVDPRLGAHSEIASLFEGLWIDDRDRVAFRAGTRTPCDVFAGQGVFLVDAGGTLTQVSDQCWQRPSNTPLPLSTPGLAMNNAGRLVLTGEQDIADTIKGGVFGWDETTGITLLYENPLGGGSEAAINNALSPQIAFLDGAGQVRRLSDGVATTLAQIALGERRFGISMDDGGRVAFLGTLSDFSAAGILIADGSTVQVAVPADSPWLLTGNPAINTTGFVFIGTRLVGGSAAETALFLATAQGITRVLGVGDAAAGSIVTGFPVDDLVPHAPAFNESGQIAVVVNLANGHQAVVRLDPPGLNRVTITDPCGQLPGSPPCVLVGRESQEIIPLTIQATNLLGQAMEFRDLDSSGAHTLPPGLAIALDTGQITGTPAVGTAGNVYDVVITVSAGSKTSQVALEWQILDPVPEARFDVDVTPRPVAADVTIQWLNPIGDYATSIVLDVMREGVLENHITGLPPGTTSYDFSLPHDGATRCFILFGIGRTGLPSPRSLPIFPGTDCVTSAVLQISNLNVTTTSTTATVTWDTNVPATGSYRYRPESGTYPFLYTVVSSAPATSFSTTISGLTASTAYVVEVRSDDPSMGAIATLERAFTTSSSGSVGPPTPGTGSSGLTVLVPANNFRLIAEERGIARIAIDAVISNPSRAASRRTQISVLDTTTLAIPCSQQDLACFNAGGALRYALGGAVIGSPDALDPGAPRAVATLEFEVDAELLFGRSLGFPGASQLDLVLHSDAGTDPAASFRRHMPVGAADLYPAILAHPVFDPLLPGGWLSLMISVRNRGPRPAASAGVHFSLPDMVDWPSVGRRYELDPEWSCRVVGTREVDCATSTAIDPESVVGRFYLELDAAHPLLPVLTTVEVTSRDPDPDLGNNVTTLATPVGTPVGRRTTELSVALTRSVAHNSMNQAFSYTMTVANNGPDVASNPSIAFYPPTGFSLTASPGSCVPIHTAVFGHGFACDVRTLGPGGILSFVFTGRLTRPGLNRADAYAWATEDWDPRGDNNGRSFFVECDPIPLSSGCVDR